MGRWTCIRIRPCLRNPRGRQLWVVVAEVVACTDSAYCPVDPLATWHSGFAVFGLAADNWFDID